jgi:hypothetical protein
MTATYAEQTDALQLPIGNHRFTQRASRFRFGPWALERMQELVTHVGVCGQDQSLHRFVQQRLRILQVRRIETLSEPMVDWTE